MNQNNNILKITHSAGFFSCCTQRLRRTIDFFNEKQKCPTIIDSSHQFGFYKTNPNIDITSLFFETNYDINIEYDHNIFFTLLRDTIDHHSDQFTDYKLLNFSEILPFVKKYFKITNIVMNKLNEYENQYNLDYSNICSIFYRGNDKYIETYIPPYSTFIDKAKKIKDKHPNIKFLIQTDDQLFLDEFLIEFPDSIFLNEIPRIHNNNSNVHYSLPINERANAAINFLASVLIVSKSKIIITHSGNCGLWAVLFRGNTENVIQYLKNNEIDDNTWYE